MQNFDVGSKPDSGALSTYFGENMTNVFCMAESNLVMGGNFSKLEDEIMWFKFGGLIILLASMFLLVSCAAPIVFADGVATFEFTDSVG